MSDLMAPSALTDMPNPLAPFPVAAGVAMVAQDTGRVLMIQRALIDGELGGGRWEMPGGKLEPGENPLDGACREWCEEVGCEMPEAQVVATWLSPNGVYQGFVFLTPEEAAVDTNMPGPMRDVQDPDNPMQGNYTEATAWFDVSHMQNGPKFLRDEVRTGTPWKLLKGASPNSTEPPAGDVAVVASGGWCSPIEQVGEAVDFEREEIRVEVGEVGVLESVEDFTPEELTAAATGGDHAPNTVKLSTGWAYPINNAADLKKAQQAFGRAKPEDRAKVKAHIVASAKRLGVKLGPPWIGGSMAASAAEPDYLVAAVDAPSSAFLPEAELPGPTPFHVKDDGTVDGHLYLWASCHIAPPPGFGSVCVKPPKEDSYDFFNLGEALTADGRSVPVGKVTVGGGHAGPDLSWRTAAAQYDDTGTTAAIVHAVPDKWGCRMPGVLVAGLDPGKVDELRRSPLSGDWRKINGRLRLVAALGVNVPGYAVPRSLVASGEAQSLVYMEEPEEFEAAAADHLAASIGLDPASRAAALHAEVLGAAS